jgi:O-antigen ligase
MNSTAAEPLNPDDPALDKNLLANKEDEEEETSNPMLWWTIGYLFLFIFRPYETLIPMLGIIHFERIYMICLLVALFRWPEKRYIPHRINYVLLAFFGVLCFSYFIAYIPDKAEDIIWEYFKLLVLYFVIIMSVRNEKEFWKLLLAFIVIMGLYIGKSEWEFFIGGRHVYRMGIKRLIGIDDTNGSPNSFAATIVYSLPFAWAMWKTAEIPRIRIGLFCYLVMALVGVALTGSRGGMLSVLFFFLLIWLRMKKKMIGLVLMVLIISVTWVFMGEKLQERFQTIYDDKINASATESAQGRIEGLLRGVELFKLRPFFGWGAGNFPYATYEIGVTDGMQSHNMYGQVMGELGAAGSISVLAIIAVLFLTRREVLSLYATADDNDEEDEGKEESARKDNLLALTAVACTDTVVLLLFQGIFGHNLYRYNWILISAFLVLTSYFAWRREDIESAPHPD